MRKLPLLVGICILSVSAISQPNTNNEQEQLLNSERIFQKFGSYGIELINQKDDIRQTSLYSENEHGRVTRTFATVKFLEPIPVEISNLHEQILAGSSIGATFKGAGWEINKYGLLIDRLTIAPPNQVLGLMHLDSAQQLALHLYLFSISRENDSPLNYALIAELHHPDYMNLAELQDIYLDSMDLSRGKDLDAQVESLLAQIKNL
jgi:hypothetical protein